MKRKFNLHFLSIRLFISVILSAFFLLSLTEKPVSAADPIFRFVSTTGTDSFDCSTSPCRTIAYAITKANAGDTIYIFSGTYHENNLNPTKNLAFLGEGMNSTIIDGSWATSRVFTISTDSLTLTFSDLTIQGGIAISGGGGGLSFSAQNGNYSLNKVKIQSNSANYGGGIIVYSSGATSNITMKDCIFSGNSVTSTPGGGALFAGSRTVSNITNTTFMNNTAPELGGAIRVDNSVALTNVTITGNSSTDGAIFVNSGASLTVVNATISQNSTMVGGYIGGINNFGSLNIKNTIIDNNSIGNCAGSGSWNSLGNNLESANTCHFTQPTDLVNTDPLLSTLADNGGYTQTMALLPDSPAVDAGTDTGCPSTDQRDFTRPQGYRCDIGAYEAQIPAVFHKSSPPAGSSNQPVKPMLMWQASSGATKYSYCIDNSNNNICDTAWVDNGTAISKTLTDLNENTTYYWQVRAENAAGYTYADLSNTGWWIFSTGEKPAAFNKVSPANKAINQPTSVTLTWQASSGATRYDICYDTTNDHACSNWTSVGTATSKSLTGLSMNTTYYWHVRAVNSIGSTYSDGSILNFYSFSTVATKPAAFNKSTPANNASNQPSSVTLTWSASSGATRYDYCYDTTNDNTCSNWVSNGTATSKKITGLVANRTYYWQIRAVNTLGTTYANGASTSFWSFKTGLLPASFSKSLPANGATNQSSNPTLRWVASTGALKYYYCIDTTNDNACTTWVDNGTATSKTLSGLLPSTKYYWHVKAVNTFGSTYSNGASTAFWSFTTGTKPAAFNKTAPTSGLTNQTDITLTWSAASGAYKYYYCVDKVNNNACDGTWVDNGTKTSKWLSGLDPLATYYWQVRAVNSFGTTYANGATTSYWNFTTGNRPAVFTKISPVNLATGIALNTPLKWHASVRASRYAYCIYTEAEGSCQSWHFIGNVTSVIVPGLVGNTTYYWEIVAQNSIGPFIYADNNTWWQFSTIGTSSDSTDSSGTD